MHDPGDEHRDGSGGLCPFCFCRLRPGNWHKTPLWEKQPTCNFEYPMSPDDIARVEVFETCGKDACIDEIQRFAEQHHMSAHRKEMLVYKRWRWPKEYR